MPIQDDCILCNCDSQYVIGESALSFATYFPRAIKRGHFVVAAKEHIPSFTGLSSNQVADLFTFASTLTKAAEQILHAEKFYIAAIDDKDRHFHIHMLPKMPGDAPMGRHIMLEGGWASEVAEVVSDDDVREFIGAVREAISETR